MYVLLYRCRLAPTAAGSNDTPDADKEENNSQEEDVDRGGGSSTSRGHDCEGGDKEAGGRREEGEDGDGDGIEITDDELSGLYGRISELRQRDVEVRSLKGRQQALINICRTICMLFASKKDVPSVVRGGFNCREQSSRWKCSEGCQDVERCVKMLRCNRTTQKICFFSNSIVWLYVRSDAC